MSDTAQQLEDLRTANRRMEDKLRELEFGQHQLSGDLERAAETLHTISGLANDINSSILGDTKGRIGIQTQVRDTEFRMRETKESFDRLHQQLDANHKHLVDTCKIHDSRLAALERQGWRNAGFATAVCLGIGALWQFAKEKLK